MGRVSDAVATREQFTADRKAVEDRVSKALGFFGHVLPSHADPDQYVALALGLVRRNAKLAQAAIEDTGSFMVALVDCARLGLVPGDTYHLVPFFDSKARVHRVTGITDYRGEIELIYRTGAVEAVHGQVVRDRDEFDWQPGMRLPGHRIADGGLATAEQRGPLLAVYAYATYFGGGLSPLVLLTRDQVARHRAAAKTQEFWGPLWPEEGPWTERMWLKTAYHRLYDVVPHSAEYAGTATRAAAEAARIPPAMLAPVRAAIDVPDDMGDPAPPALQAAAEPEEQP